MGIWLEKSASWWPAKGGLDPSGLLHGSAARRASGLTKVCAHVISDAIGELNPALPIVFGSCLGSVSVLFTLLDQMAEDDGGISPIRFSGSVHHAPVSTIGIASRHTGPVSAISANHDLCAMALIEALGVAHEHGEVLLVVGDEAWPAAFGLPRFEQYAAALLLRADHDRALTIELTEPRPPGELPEGLTGNPSAAIERFIEWAPTATSGDVCPLTLTEDGSWVARCR